MAVNLWSPFLSHCGERVSRFECMGHALLVWFPVPSFHWLDASSTKDDTGIGESKSLPRRPGPMRQRALGYQGVVFGTARDRHRGFVSPLVLIVSRRLWGEDFNLGGCIMSSKSKIQENKGPFPNNVAVQTPNPLVTCVLQRYFEGTFCFDWGQSSKCSALGITIKRGESMKGSLGFSFKGASFSHEITQTAETTVTYSTGACDICQPVICFDGRLLVYECERFLGFWSWKTIDNVWAPTSRGTIDLNCVKNHPDCKCSGGQTSQTAIPTAGTQQTALLSEHPRASKLLRTQDFRINTDGNATSSDDSETVTFASQALEAFAADRDRTAADLLLDVGVVRVDGSVAWIVGSDPVEAAATPEITILSHSAGRNMRDYDVIRDVENRRLPILAVTRCRPDLRATVKVRLGGSPDGPMTEFASEQAQIASGRVTTIFASIDLSEAEPNSFGVYDLELVDTSGCVVASRQEPFLIAPTPDGGGGKPRSTPS